MCWIIGPVKVGDILDSSIKGDTQLSKVFDMAMKVLRNYLVQGYTDCDKAEVYLLICALVTLH